MEKSNNLKWHQKPGGITALLILFAPIGIYLMWKNNLWTKQTRWIVTIFLVLIIIGNMNKEDINSVGTIEGTEKCLVGFDWVYPSGNNPTGAWKFSGNGKFTSSTTMFGGMSTWGVWEIIEPGKINITYTRTTEGTIPDGQTLILEDCSTLIVGSTTYIKD